MKTLQRLAFLVPLAFGLAACTTVGTGAGEVVAAGGASAPVSFEWTSTDGGMSGTMTAALPELAYQGPFFQITRQTRVESLAPLWTHWHHGWGDWPYAGETYTPVMPGPQFITYFSGKVLATLEAPGNQRMRCRFRLVMPSRGMGGGGEGECQLTGGRVVRAVFKAN